MKKVLLTHIYNEAYLLEFWLKIHRNLFDHLVVIDRFSTDRSREVIGDLWPGAEIHTSTDREFDALKCDYEMIRHETRFEGDWKMVLNATEFIANSDLDRAIVEAERDDLLGMRCHGAVMVDTEPETPPEPEIDLTEQKFHGFYERDFDYQAFGKPEFLRRPNRSRLLHRAFHGCYGPGRHDTLLSKTRLFPRHLLSLWWYAYSPLSPEAIARKLQIAQGVTKHDLQVGWGAAHLVEEDEVRSRHKLLLPFAKDLRPALKTPEPRKKTDPVGTEKTSLLNRLRKGWAKDAS